MWTEQPAPQAATVETRATINYDWSCAAAAEETALVAVPPSGGEGHVVKAACTAMAVKHGPWVASVEDGAGTLRAEASPFKPRGAGRRVHVERWVKGRLRETTARSSGTQILRVKLKSASLTSGVDCC